MELEILVWKLLNFLTSNILLLLNDLKNKKYMIKIYLKKKDWYVSQYILLYIEKWGWHIDELKYSFDKINKLS